MERRRVVRKRRRPKDGVASGESRHPQKPDRVGVDPRPVRPDAALPHPSLGFLGIVSWALAAAAVVLIFCLIGGMRPIFSLPSYSILGLAAIAGALAPLLGQYRVRWRPVWMFLLFAGYLGWRALTSPVPYLAQVDYFALLACVIVYLLTVFCFPLHRWRIALVWVLLALALAHVVVGAIQFKDGEQFMLFGFIRPDYEERASGLLICPNHLGGYLEMVLMLALSLTVWSRIPLFWKMLSAYLCVVCLAGIALTISRGTMLSTMGGVLTFVILSMAVGLRTRRKEMLRGALIALLACLLVGYGAYSVATRHPHISQRVENIVNKNNNRFQMWEAGFMQFLKNPVTGTGAGTFLYYGRMFRPPPPGYKEDPIHVHNDYIHLLAEYGAVGYALFLLAFGAHVGAGLRSMRWITDKRLPASDGRHSDSLALQIGAMSALATITLHSIVDFNMHIPGNALVMAFILGILASPGIERARTRDGIRSPRIFPMALLLCLGLLSLFLFPKRIPGEHYAEKARVALRDQSYAEAVRFAKKGLKHMDDNPELYHHYGEARLFWAGTLGESFLAQALYEDAVRQLKQGLELFPQDVWRLINLGQALDGTRRFEEARKIYEKAIAVDPNNGQPYGFLGLHYERRGMPKQAAQAYQRSIRTGLGTSLANSRLPIVKRQLATSPD